MTIPEDLTMPEPKLQIDEKDCAHQGQGGVYTQGDGGGARRALGLLEHKYRHYCWNCWAAFGSAWADAVKKETMAEIKARNLCGFFEAWIGECLNPIPCGKHAQQKCFACGQPATKNCSHTSTLVCGIPECDIHTHTHGTLTEDAR